MHVTQRGFRTFGATIFSCLAVLQLAKFYKTHDDIYPLFSLVHAFAAMAFSHAKIKEKPNVQRANGKS